MVAVDRTFEIHHLPYPETGAEGFESTRTIRFGLGTPEEVAELFNSGQDSPYEHVANIKAFDLSAAYYGMQNIDVSWARASNVTAFKSPHEIRSTSVGDVIVDLGSNVAEWSAYLVTPLGFKPLPIKD